MEAMDPLGSDSRVARWSRVAFAVTLTCLGAVGLIRGDLVSLWLPVPDRIPWRPLMVIVTALVPLASGIGLLGTRFASVASRALLGYLLAWLVVVNGFPLVVQFGTSTAWAAARTAAVAAAACVLQARFSAGGEDVPWAFLAGGTGLRVGRSLFGLALIPFGVAHFTYVQRTTAMVPPWLPWHLAWAYFFGCTFIAAGVAVTVDVRAHLAAALSTVQLAVFTVLVWVPVLVSGPGPSDWREFVTSWLLTLAAWVVTDSYRGQSVGSAPLDQRRP